MKVKPVEHILGSGWQIEPAGGVTGEAFFAKHQNDKLFLKRNSSPFLAVLSAEGIVPKLIWTKRLENGDVITAQKWVEGRVLEPREMNNPDVAKLLKKIHGSQPLLTMMRRLGKKPLSPDTMLRQLAERLHPDLKKEKVALAALYEQLPLLPDDQWAVCHSDVHHQNWLLTKDGRLYLIDWEQAAISDPALDLGPLLYWYIPESGWENWLRHYGAELTNQLRHRMKWYAIYQTIWNANFYKNKGEEEISRFWSQYLDKIQPFS